MNAHMVYYVSCATCEYEDRMETIAEILERQEEHQTTYNSSHVLEFDVRK